MAQTNPKFLHDLSRVASGALATIAGARAEIEALVRQRVRRMLADADLVTRDEFEAVKAMAAKARTEQERLAKRLAELEEAKPAAKRATARPKRAAPRRCA